MPIIPVNVSKLVATDETKTRGVIFEFPKDMGNGELLDRINEVRQALIKNIEESAKAEDAKVEEVKNDQVENESEK